MGLCGCDAWLCGSPCLFWKPRLGSFSFHAHAHLLAVRLLVLTAVLLLWLQLEGTLFNNGSVAACNVRIKPLGSGIQTFWPDWASNSQYDNYFNMGQVRRLP